MTDWLEQSWAYWQSGGTLLIPIALVSLGIWAYFVRTHNHLARWVRQSHQIEPIITELDKQAGPADVLQKLGGIPGGITRIICTVMNDVLRGAVLAEAFDQREDESMRTLRRDMIILGALTVVAPLLGLLGTVMGMIETFDAVSTVGGETGSRVASGISRALITTQFGLIVALPGVFGVARLRRLLSHVEVRLSECRMLIVALLERNKGGLTQ
jgi:biopolymer transport protein ExbB